MPALWHDTDKDVKRECAITSRLDIKPAMIFWGKTKEIYHEVIGMRSVFHFFIIRKFGALKCYS